MSIINCENELITNWYKKPTTTKRYLNFFSHSPSPQRVGIIYCLVDRCILLLDSRFHKKNTNKVVNILFSNDYPYKFIMKYINKR